jgi:vacuolar-type H+-ATPase subunit H
MDREEIAIAEAVEFDEEVSAFERKVEAEEDERDEKEKKKKEKETERKKVLSQKKKEIDDIFYGHWINKIKAFKALIPETENTLEGKGKDKKYKAEFRRQATLFLQEIKKLNIGGGK